MKQLKMSNGNNFKERREYYLFLDFDKIVFFLLLVVKIVKIHF